MLHRQPCLNIASDNDCNCPGATPPTCHIQQGSLVDEWTDELELTQEWAQDKLGRIQCTRLAAWEVQEGRGSAWMPICTMHYAVMTDAKQDHGYSSPMDFRRPTLSYVIDEEQDLDDQVEFLFAKATQMAKRFPGYDPNRERVTPNIDALLKENLREALRKK